MAKTLSLGGTGAERKTKRTKPSVEPEEPFLHELHRTMVTIRVGDEKYPFLIHKEVICHYSDYFHAMFKGSFSEAETGVVDLPEDEVAVFKMFECWIYSGECRLPEDPLNWNFGAEEMKRETLEALRDVWVDHSKLCSLQTTRHAYESTPASSPLRRLLVDMFGRVAVPEVWKEHMLDFPQEFLSDVILVNMKRLHSLEDESPYQDKYPFEGDFEQYLESGPPPSRE